jgi:hypothetical protein
MAIPGIRIPTWLGGKTRAEANKDAAVQQSVDNIDANATGAAAASQSRKDDDAERHQSPADQGGQG